MKVFLTAVSSLCLCAIFLYFLVYATNQLPGIPVVTVPETEVVADPLCSPCVEKMASILEIMERESEGNMNLFLNQLAKPSPPVKRVWEGLSSEQREQAQQLIDQYGSEEGLRRFREIDPEAAQQFDRERRPPPAREVPSEIEPSAQ